MLLLSFITFSGKLQDHFFVDSFSGTVLNVKFSVNYMEKTAVEKAFKDFLRYLRVERNYSDHTVRNYQSDLRQFAEFMRQRDKQAGEEGKTPLVPGQVNHLDIRAYLASLYRRNAKSSVARKLSALRSFFGYLVRQAERVRDLWFRDR